MYGGGMGMPGGVSENLANSNPMGKLRSSGRFSPTPTPSPAIPAPIPTPTVTQGKKSNEVREFYHIIIVFPICIAI